MKLTDEEIRLGREFSAQVLNNMRSYTPEGGKILARFFLEGTRPNEPYNNAVAFAEDAVSCTEAEYEAGMLEIKLPALQFICNRFLAEHNDNTRDEAMAPAEP